MNSLIAVDWGTSSLRGARLDATGQVIDERSFARGILTVAPGGFPGTLAESFGDWLEDEHSLCLISGMAGSRQGWQEAPYCPCPASFAQVGQALTWITPGRIGLVPGLCTVNEGVPDVMRGEEVQIFGAMHLSRSNEGVFVLPGTHSKWATVSEGRVTGFRSFMTGEVYALLSQQSILAKTLPAGAPFDEAAFSEGVRRAQKGLSLLHTAFGTRTLALFEQRPAAALPSYLSGLVIGEELRAQSLPASQGSAVTLIGSDALTQRYALALSLLGTPSRCLGAEATWAGLFAIAQGIAQGTAERP